MRVQFDPYFYTLYKNADVRIRRAVDEKIKLFQVELDNLSLNNYELHDEYEEFKSIDITNDYRAMYEEVEGAARLSPISHYSVRMKNYINSTLDYL